MKRALATIAACLMVLVLLIPSFAMAQNGSAAEVSEEGKTAKIEGCSFAVGGFNRAQVGSNRENNGVYDGYCYYAASTIENLSVVATKDYAVVYVPNDSAANTGCDIQDNADVADLQQLLIDLDAKAAQGGTVLSNDMQWHYTNDTTYTVGDATFIFDKEVKTGQYYSCVIGGDGSDITDPSNPSYVQLTHADFGKLIPADEAVIVEGKTGLSAFVDFLQNLDYSPLWVTLKTTGVAIVIIFILGLAGAYFSLRIPSRAQDIVDSIFTIPMVLPPTVCGFLLLLLLGKNTAVGQWFIDIGFPLVFSPAACVIAAVVVAFPLMYRSARGAFEGLDANMLDAARTLGWSNGKVFFRLMIPLAWNSIAAGTVLAFARALGEFGATLFLASNFVGVTRTIPIAIYFEWMNGNLDVAIFWTVVIIIISFIVILFINLWGRRTTKYKRRLED